MVEGINTKDIVRLMAEEIFDLTGDLCPAERYGYCPLTNDDTGCFPLDYCSYEDISCWIKYFERKAKEKTP